MRGVVCTDTARSDGLKDELGGVVGPCPGAAKALEAGVGTCAGVAPGGIGLPKLDDRIVDGLIIAIKHLAGEGDTGALTFRRGEVRPGYAGVGVIVLACCQTEGKERADCLGWCLAGHCSTFHRCLARAGKHDVELIAESETGLCDIERESGHQALASGLRRTLENRIKIK